MKKLALFMLIAIFFGAAFGILTHDNGEPAELKEVTAPIFNMFDRLAEVSSKLFKTFNITPAQPMPDLITEYNSQLQTLIGNEKQIEGHALDVYLVPLKFVLVKHTSYCIPIKFVNDDKLYYLVIRDENDFKFNNQFFFIENATFVKFDDKRCFYGEMTLTTLNVGQILAAANDPNWQGGR